MLSERISLNNAAPYVRYVHELHLCDIPITVPRRVIYDHELIFIVSGHGVLNIENRTHSLEPGALYLVRPHLKHSFDMPGGQRIRYFAVHFDFVYLGEQLDFSAEDVYLRVDIQAEEIQPDARWAQRPVPEIGDIFLPETVRHADAGRLLPLFQALLESFQLKRFGYELEMRAHLLQILVWMVRSGRTDEGVHLAHKHHGEITRAIAYLRDHFLETPDISWLARELGFSPNHFRSLFKEATGFPPLEYLTRIRMEQAKKLLLENRHTVSEVAQLTGYDSIHSFSRVFKKMEGISPSQYASSLTRAL